MGFSKNEIITLRIIAHTKRKHAYNWYVNNMLYPVGLIITPYLFTIISNDLRTLNYTKSFLDILLNGSLCLLGFNVLRGASALIVEKLDESEMYNSNVQHWNNVKSEIVTIKNKLNNYSTGCI